MKRYLLTAWLCLFVLLCEAQRQPERFYVQLSGVVTDHFSGDPIKGALVRLLKAGKQEAEVITRGGGEYSFELDRGWRYSVWYSAEGRVTKRVDISTEDIPAYPDVPYYEMDVQITLFLWVEDFDFSLFGEPIAEASYKHSVRNLSWDSEYTERMRTDLSRVMDEYEKAYKGYYKRQAGRRPAPPTFERPVEPDSMRSTVPGPIGP